MLMLNAMRAVTEREGFTQGVTVGEHNPHASVLHRVLNAGATIGAVRHAGGNSYELRAELFEYLSLVAKRALTADKSHVALADLEEIVWVALLPEVEGNVETVLHYVHPIEDRPTLLEKVGLKERHDFTAEIKLNEVYPDHRKVVRNALNAGATMEHVQRASNNHYFVSRDFYKTLARIRAGFLHSPSRPVNGGALSAKANGANAIDDGRQQRFAIADHRKRDESPEHSATSADNLRAEIWDRLLSAIGLNLTQASRVDDRAVRDQASAAWQAMCHLSQSNSRFQKYLKEIEKTKADAIDERYRELRSVLEDNQGDVAVLDQVAGQLHGLIRALLLLPEVGVLPQLIEKLQRAVGYEGGPAPGEDELLEKLRSLELGIRHIDRSSPDAWKRVAQMINGRDAASTIRDMNTVNETPY